MAIFGITQTLTDGNHTVTIAAGLWPTFTAIQAFTSSFYNGINAPRVVASSIQEGQTSIPPGDLVYTVTFSEAMDTGVSPDPLLSPGNIAVGPTIPPASSSTRPAPRRRLPTPACPTTHTRSLFTATRSRIRSDSPWMASRWPGPSDTTSRATGSREDTLTSRSTRESRLYLPPAAVVLRQPDPPDAL